MKLAWFPSRTSNDKSSSTLRADPYRIMRVQLQKLTKQNSTKYERRFAEILKSMRIPFKVKVEVCGHEVDFIIGKKIIEIDGHDQDRDKNKIILESGYDILHIKNNEINDSDIKLWLIKLQI